MRPTRPPKPHTHTTHTQRCIHRPDHRYRTSHNHGLLASLVHRTGTITGNKFWGDYVHKNCQKKTVRLLHLKKRTLEKINVIGCSTDRRGYTRQDRRRVARLHLRPQAFLQAVTDAGQKIWFGGTREANMHLEFGSRRHRICRGDWRRGMEHRRNPQTSVGLQKSRRLGNRGSKLFPIFETLKLT